MPNSGLDQFEPRLQKKGAPPQGSITSRSQQMRRFSTNIMGCEGRTRKQQSRQGLGPGDCWANGYRGPTNTWTDI